MSPSDTCVHAEPHAERLYSHLRHVLTFLHWQHRDAGDAIGLQAQQRGEGTPAGWRAPSRGVCRRHAEQGQRQGREKGQGLEEHHHAQRRMFQHLRRGLAAVCVLSVELIKSQRGAFLHSSWRSQLVRVWCWATAVLSRRRGQAGRQAGRLISVSYLTAHRW